MSHSANDKPLVFTTCCGKRGNTCEHEAHDHWSFMYKWHTEELVETKWNYILLLNTSFVFLLKNKQFVLTAVSNHQPHLNVFQMLKQMKWFQWWRESLSRWTLVLLKRLDQIIFCGVLEVQRFVLLTLMSRASLYMSKARDSKTNCSLTVKRDLSP